MSTINKYLTNNKQSVYSSYDNLWAGMWGNFHSKRRLLGDLHC